MKNTDNQKVEEWWEGKNILQTLGIEKGDEWLDKQCVETLDLLNKNLVPLNQFLIEALQEKNFLTFIVATKLNRFEDAVQLIIGMFFQLGYMRGKVEQEIQDKLESIWGTGVKDK